MKSPFNRREVDSIYVDEKDRFVVSLIVSYEEAPETMETPADAAAFALDLTRDLGSNDTVWFVYDRKTGESHRLEQADFEEVEV